MEKLNAFLEKLNLENNISLEDIPEIDLYMDQVIQLFEKKFNETKRNEDDKVLTKTMINNYAKGKVFVPIKNKKYSKEHLILISLIYQLKGSLSIKDIKDLLQRLNNKVSEGDFQLDKFYKSYLNLHAKNVESFNRDSQVRAKEVEEELMNIEDKDQVYLEKVLLIASFVNISNFYRRAAEKLIDELVEEEKYSQ